MSHRTALFLQTVNQRFKTGQCFTACKLPTLALCRDGPLLAVRSSSLTPRSSYAGASPRLFSMQRGGSGTGSQDVASAEAYRQELYFAELLGYRYTRSWPVVPEHSCRLH